MFDSLQLSYVLKSICEDFNISVLPDLDLPSPALKSYKTSINDFTKSVSENGIKSIQFFSIECLEPEFSTITHDTNFIVRCIVR